MTELLGGRGIWISELRPAELSLEEEFLRLTQGDDDDAPVGGRGADMARLFRMEVRRALHRRLVWGLIALALVGSVVAAIAVFLATRGQDLTAMGPQDMSAARVVDWWRPDIPDGVVLPPAIMLMLGGLLGGASVVGAEWRTGGVATILSWMPRRRTLILTRLAAAGILAVVIAFALQVLFLAGLLPSVVAHGTTEGANGDYLASLFLVLVRVAVLTGVAAVLGGAVASLGRNTAAALVAVWAWLLVGEGLVRTVRPGLSRFLLGENINRFVTYRADPAMDFERPGWLGWPPWPCTWWSPRRRRRWCSPAGT